MRLWFVENCDVALCGCGARSGVSCDLAGGLRYLGEPAIAEGDQKRIYISMRDLPQMRRDRKLDSQLGKGGCHTPSRRGAGSP